MMATGSREIGRKLCQHGGVIAGVFVVVFVCELALSRNIPELCRMAVCTALMVPSAVLDSIYGKLYHRLSACMIISGMLFASVMNFFYGGGYGRANYYYNTYYYPYPAYYGPYYW